MIPVAVPAAALAPKVRVMQIAYSGGIREGRLRARGAGVGAKGSFRDRHTNCYEGDGYACAASL